jgi:hypothetical protein
MRGRCQRTCQRKCSVVSVRSIWSTHLTLVEWGLEVLQLDPNLPFRSFFFLTQGLEHGNLALYHLNYTPELLFFETRFCHYSYPDWPWIHCPSASASQVTGIIALPHHAQLLPLDPIALNCQIKCSDTGCLYILWSLCDNLPCLFVHWLLQSLFSVCMGYLFPSSHVLSACVFTDEVGFL